MDIDHLHLYVDDGNSWRNWFRDRLGLVELPRDRWQGQGDVALAAGQIQIRLSGTHPQLTRQPTVRQFLQRYSPGISDVAFRVKDLERVVAQAQGAGATLTQPVQTVVSAIGVQRRCQILGWGSLTHTLVSWLEPFEPARDRAEVPAADLPWQHIDHAVLNVPTGQLEAAATWYEQVLGFQRQQHFAIETSHSGLRSLVLKHPEGGATLPINEPTSPNSQVQEFLNAHHGAGIQHVALQTADLIHTVAVLRQRGVNFLSVPQTYYEQLQQRPGYWAEADDWQAIAQQQILVDWLPEMPQARLLQVFTQPLFEQPTLFLELIERQRARQGDYERQAEGFGQGNFQALFEAIEREQQQRGTL